VARLPLAKDPFPDAVELKPATTAEFDPLGP
jgi:hypothetical protein